MVVAWNPRCFILWGVAIFGSQLPVSVGESEMISACLRNDVRPPADCDSEAASLWKLPTCLTTPIPAWTAPIDRVQECFQCCMERATKPFQAQAQFWHSKMSHHLVKRHVTGWTLRPQ